MRPRLRPNETTPSGGPRVSQQDPKANPLPVESYFVQAIEARVALRRRSNHALERIAEIDTPRHNRASLRYNRLSFAVQRRCGEWGQSNGRNQSAGRSERS